MASSSEGMANNSLSSTVALAGGMRQVPLRYRVRVPPIAPIPPRSLSIPSLKANPWRSWSPWPATSTPVRAARSIRRLRHCPAFGDLRCGRRLSLGRLQRPQGPQYDPSETHQHYDIEEEKREHRQCIQLPLSAFAGLARLAFSPLATLGAFWTNVSACSA
jgi:hypothetical protein